MSQPRHAGARTFLRPALITLSALSLITCAEDPIGPASGEARLRLVPVFQDNARVAPLTIDRVRVLIQREGVSEEIGETVVDDTLTFDLDLDQLRIDDISIRMTQPIEQFQVTLELLAGTTLLFQGSEIVTVTRGRASAATQIPVTYQGPGSNVASLVLGPRDTTVIPGASVNFRLDAFDGQGLPVPQYYASWSLTGGPATGARINAAGLLTAPAVRDTFYVKAINLPTGVMDSTRVIVAPFTPPPPVEVIPTPLAAGTSHTCEIRPGGTYCWGRNDDGQLGDGTNTTRLIPTPVLGGHAFVAVSAGEGHTCALTAQGQAFCWGHNFSGELGDGTTTGQNTPVAVTGGRTFAQIAAANEFTCAVTLQGAGYCWGSNFDGQLGNGTSTSSPTPVAVAGGHNFTRISAAGVFDITSDHACALDAAGQAWCWGANSDGQLGDGSQTNSPIPVAVSGGLLFAEISLGGESSCAITTAGAGFCWGFNFGAQLTTPQPVAGGFTYSALDMGGNHVCGRTATGWVCGGDGAAGQLGDGTGTDHQTPVAPSGGLTFTVMAAGGLHTCGITGTGTFCWGSNNGGQLGTGDVEFTSTLTPVPVSGAPASATMGQGNGQSAPVGTAVALRSEVLVRDAAGIALPGVEVTWAIASGGGTVDNNPTMTSVTDGSGFAVSGVWILGPAAGANTLTATVSALGVTGNPVTFTATGTAAPDPSIAWTGAASSDWGVAGNWNPAQVPGPTDSVVIGAAGQFQPVLSADVVVAAVNIVAGGRLTIGPHGLGTLRGLSTGGTGVLVMQDDAGVVSVGGHARFDGGSELDLLSAGGLSIAGNLTQQATNSGDSFHPSGTHVTVFTGTAPSISFASPGLIPGTSHFQDLVWVGGGTMTLLTPVMAHGAMTITSLAAGTITSATGSRLTVGDLVTAAGLTLANVPLTISQTVAGSLSLNNISFTGMPTDVAQLVIDHPGATTAFTFSNLQFLTTPVAPNGFYLDVTDNNGATDSLLTINMEGAAPASGDPFVRTAGGAVVNWPFIPVITWTGAVSTDWSNPGNWNPAGVPAADDDVDIVPATLQPTLTADVAVHQVRVRGAGARLTIGGRTLTLSGNLVVHTDGLLVMTDPADRVIVNGNAAFQGGNETGLLSAGELHLFGSFNQQQQTTPLSFVASGSHRTVMRNTGTLQEVTFCCTANTSGFQNLDLSQSLGINIQFNGFGVPVFDTLISRVGTGTAPWLYMLGKPLTARRFAVDRLTVDRGTLTLNEGGAPGNQQLDNVTFQNYLPTQTQLAVTAAGGSPDRTLTFTNLAFQPLTAGDAGRYLTVTSSTATLVVNLPGGTPAANGPAFTTTTGAATVNWPSANITWTGAVSTDWHTAANWSPAVVPTASADVTIPAGTPSAPTMSTTFATIHNLTVAAGATLTLTTFSLTASGNVDVGGAIAGNSTLVLSGSGVTLRGSIQDLTINGSVTLNGNTTTAAIGTVSVSGAGADLNLGGFTLVANNFLTQNGATLTMTNPADSLVSTGTAQFAGGSTLGRLTAGAIELRASLVQSSAGSTTSFASTGTRVWSTSAGAVTYGFASGGPTFSRFSTLIVNNGTGAVSLTGTVVATDSISVLSPTTLSVAGQLLPLRTLRLATGAGVGGAGALRIRGDSLFVATPASYSIATTDFNGTGPQLIPALTYANLALSGTGPHILTGTTLATGGVSVTGDGASLVLANHRLTANLFSTTGNAVLSMTQPLDSLVVSGNATFNGGDESASLTAGVLSVGGSLTTAAPTSFIASGTHRTVFAGTTGQNLTIANGGASATRFQEVEVRNTGAGVTLGVTGQVLQVNGSLSLPTTSTLTGGGAVVAGSVTTVAGSTLGVFQLTVPASAIAVLGNYGVTQTILTGGGAIPAIAYNHLQLAGATPYSLSGPTLSTVGNLEVPGELNIAIGNVTVGGTFRTSGSGVLVMTGSTGQVTADSAVFEGGDETGRLTDGVLTVTRAFVVRPTNSPTSFVGSGNHRLNLTGGTVDVSADFLTRNQTPVNHLTSDAAQTTIDWLRVSGNATFTGSNANAGTLDVRGTLTTASSTGFGLDSLILGGAIAPGSGYIAANHYIFDQTAGTQTIPGGSVNLPYELGDVSVRSDAVLAGPVTTSGLSIDGTGRLALGGNTATVSGNFLTAGNGALVQSAAADVLMVGGNATFGGGSEVGLLSAGLLQVGGNFTQSGAFTDDRFTASGTHVTRLAGGTSTINTVGSNLGRLFATLELATTGPVIVNHAGTAASLDGTGQFRVTTPVTVTLNQVGTTPLDFVGGVTTVPGSSLQGTNVTLNFPGSLIQGSYSVTNTLLSSGTVPYQVPALPYQNLTTRGAGQPVYFPPGATTINGNLTLGQGSGARLTDSLGVRSLVSVTGSVLANAQLLVLGGKLTVGDSLFVGTGANSHIAMTSDADTVIVSGNATFAGSSATTLTAGLVRVDGSFSQLTGPGGNILSYPASGTHKTVLGSAAAASVSFQNPGLAAAGSHFQVLDVSAATGGLALGSVVFADSLISTTPTATISSAGLALTVRRSQVSGLSLVNTPFILDEQSTFQAENFSNVAFTGFPTANTIMLTVRGPGNSFAPRPTVTTTNVDFQALPVGANNFYVDLTTTNDQAFNLVMVTSNQATNLGGNGAALTRLTPASGIATVTW